VRAHFPKGAANRPWGKVGRRRSDGRSALPSPLVGEGGRAEPGGKAAGRRRGRMRGAGRSAMLQNEALLASDSQRPVPSSTPHPSPAATPSPTRGEWKERTSRAAAVPHPGCTVLTSLRRCRKGGAFVTANLPPCGGDVRQDRGGQRRAPPPHPHPSPQGGGDSEAPQNPLPLVGRGKGWGYCSARQRWKASSRSRR